MKRATGAEKIVQYGNAKKIASFKGIDIFAIEQKAGKKGKDRIYISIRQEKPKRWRIFASLSYVNGADIRFEKEIV